MIRLVRELARPYRGSRLVILLAMLVETAMSFLTLWPLKVIIDNVVATTRCYLAGRHIPSMDDA